VTFKLDFRKGIEMNVIGVKVIGVVVNRMELILWVSTEWDSSGGSCSLGCDFASNFGGND